MPTGLTTPSGTPTGCTGLAEAKKADRRYAPAEPPTCPDDHAHSTWCYNSHGCRCAACRGAWAAARRKTYRQVQVRSGKPVTIGSAPIVRRLRALAVIGYGLGELSELMGLNRNNLAEIRRGERRTVHVTTARKVVTTYRKLWMSPSRDARAPVVSERARAAGYHSPLHWVDIDKGIADDDRDE